jgi:hypothetical protein
MMHLNPNFGSKLGHIELLQDNSFPVDELMYMNIRVN